MILVREDADLAKKINKSVFPGLQGGPHMNNIAAKAIAFGEALQPSFKTYCEQILKNAKAMEAVFKKEGVRMIGGGTSNHLILADVSALGVTGKEAETVLDEVGITLNKNMIPDEPRTALDPSGIRFGTPAMTTRGMKETEATRLAEIMIETMKQKDDVEVKGALRAEVMAMCNAFPVPEKFI